jgi:fructoselysine transporter
VAVGGGAFVLWARSKREWPFGPKHIEEQYLNADPRLLEFDEDDLASPLPAGDR